MASSKKKEVSELYAFRYYPAVILELDLPAGGRKGRELHNFSVVSNCSARCPDLARGENQLCTSTDNNAYRIFFFAPPPPGGGLVLVTIQGRVPFWPTTTPLRRNKQW